MLKKIISGFQTGVDIAAIKAAKAVELETGGAMPKGFLTLEGPRPEYRELYGAYELPSTSYPARTRENVVKADATFILSFHLSPGTIRTLKECERIHGYGYLILRNGQGILDGFKEGRREYVECLAEFLAKHETVNIAGNRDADEAAVEEWLTEAFRLALRMPTGRKAEFDANNTKEGKP